MRDAEQAEPSNPIVFHEQATVAYLQSDYQGKQIILILIYILIFSCRANMSQINSSSLQSYTSRKFPNHTITVLQRFLGTSVRNNGTCFDAFGSI